MIKNNNQNNALDLESITFNVSMVKFTKNDGHAIFTFRVVCTNSISFHLEDRYSSMRSF